MEVVVYINNDIKKIYAALNDYSLNSSLGGSNNSASLHKIINGYTLELQEVIGKKKEGTLLFKFMNKCSDPRDNPMDYKMLLYYNKKNLPSLIEKLSHEERSYCRAFGYTHAHVATEKEVKESYENDFKRFKIDYNNYVNRFTPIYDTYTSFTHDPNSINVRYFHGKGVCNRVLIVKASEKNIAPDNLFMEEHEVYDLVTSQNFVELIPFNEFLQKYPKYSISFRNFLKKRPQLRGDSLEINNHSEEMLEIKDIMDRLIKNIDEH